MVSSGVSVGSGMDVGSDVCVACGADVGSDVDGSSVGGELPPHALNRNAPAKRIRMVLFIRLSSYMVCISIRVEERWYILPARGFDRSLGSPCVLMGMANPIQH